MNHMRLNQTGAGVHGPGTGTSGGQFTTHTGSTSDPDADLEPTPALTGPVLTGDRDLAVAAAQSRLDIEHHLEQRHPHNLVRIACSMHDTPAGHVWDEDDLDRVEERILDVLDDPTLETNALTAVEREQVNRLNRPIALDPNLAGLEPVVRVDTPIGPMVLVRDQDPDEQGRRLYRVARDQRKTVR